ncbi:MAG: hypothetical protein ABIE75_01250 [Candidatus Omnitrophota bacterium]
MARFISQAIRKEAEKVFHNSNVSVIVPPHVGQNTSQVSNRIKHYLKLYKPRLIVLMVGCNNTWSFAESHIIRFLDSANPETLRIKLLLTLDNFRLFKGLRYLYQRLINGARLFSTKTYLKFISGHPEYVLEQTQIWAGSFTDVNKEAFRRLWKYDLRKIIKEAKRHDAKVILMTYHINPTNYLSVSDYVSMAQEQEVLLIRNDQSFEPLIRNETVNSFLLYDDWYPDKHWHPNKKGYAIIAENIFEQIKNNKLLNPI